MSASGFTGVGGTLPLWSSSQPYWSNRVDTPSACGNPREDKFQSCQPWAMIIRIGLWPDQQMARMRPPFHRAPNGSDVKLQAAFTCERTSGAPLAARKERFCLSELQAA